jgi:predicted small secreted protein
MQKMKLILTCLMIVSGVLLTGCNTVKGFGQDMQQGGQELQKAATDNGHS